MEPWLGRRGWPIRGTRVGAVPPPFPLGRHSRCPGSSLGTAPPRHHTGGKGRAVSCVSMCVRVSV